jgi:hypothetical protein
VVADPFRHLIGRPWRDVTLPRDAVGIPTMLSKAERRLLYSLARDYASGEALIDAGCLIGGSTLRSSPASTTVPTRWPGRSGWVQAMVEVARTSLIAERDRRKAGLAELRSIAERHTGRGLVLSCIDDMRPQIAAGILAAR